jgi:hypothetical protein
VKPQQGTKNQSVVRGAGFQLKQKKEYIKYKFPSSLSGSKDLCFYIGNHEPSLPERTGGVPKSHPEWNKNPSDGEMEQVRESIDLIQALKLMGVMGVSVTYSFFEQRIQPLQKRSQFGFDYLE